jgi:hypothetical protein
MPQSVGYGEAEILRVGIRPGKPATERLAPCPCRKLKSGNIDDVGRRKGG